MAYAQKNKDKESVIIHLMKQKNMTRDWAVAKYNNLSHKKKRKILTEINK